MSDPRPESAAKPISELVSVPDFPHSVLGERVDIKGYIGEIVEIVKNSIKVRSAEGNMVSYNFHTLRRIYGPRLPQDETPIEPVPAETPAPKPQPKREIIEEPDFQSPLVPIESLVNRADFPKCALGTHVDFHGHSGVVVELVNRSIKVRSREGSTCSYNADGLRKIYAQNRPATSAVS